MIRQLTPAAEFNKVIPSRPTGADRSLTTIVTFRTSQNSIFTSGASVTASFKMQVPCETERAMPEPQPTESE
ncbi:MAG: hypothetical protein CMM07_00295 [Rhodopirellula sp.]|nr:hypothetical protein [Rhodopirellula sp.]